MSSSRSHITVNLMRGCLVATLQRDVDPTILGELRTDLLAQLHHTGARRVILDCSGIEIMDRADFETLRRIVASVTLMGARSVIAGLRPGVASALAELGVSLGGITTALGLDEALALLDAFEPRA